MNSEYVVRVWDGSEEIVPEFLLALREIFPTSSPSEDWLRWKHLRNPLGPSILTFARHRTSGRVVALRFLWRHRLIVRGTGYLCFQACDTGVAAPHRRRGLFTALTQTALARGRLDGGAIVFNFPNAKSRPGYLKLGFRELPAPSLLGVLFRPLKVLLARFNTPTTGLTPKRLPPAVLKRSDLTNWPAREPPASEWSIADHYSDQRRVWRFQNHPTQRYVVANHTHHGRAVVRVNRRGGLLEAHLMEWEDESLEDSRLVLRRLARTVRDVTGADFVTILGKPSAPRVAFGEGGPVVRLPSRLSHTGLALQPEFEWVVNPSGAWRLRGRDIDTF